MMNVKGKYIAPSSLGGGIPGIAPKKTIKFCNHFI